MTIITLAVPDELAEAARIQGLLAPKRLTPLMCEMLVRVTAANNAANQEVTSGPFIRGFNAVGGFRRLGAPRGFCCEP